ncbi:MAG TPA: ParB/RepB/Spo0J family partition protein [Ktedonobacteraceae bacterium]|nr:ParB/RepB/Spo0J family partition protein [Ktedonobacteraceae bacterium]
MAKQKFGLGRGLDALLPGASEIMPPQQPSRIDENAILLAAIDSIIPNPRQPRRIFREDDPKLLELSASITQHGLLQPIVVTRLDALEAATGKKKSPSSDPWVTEDVRESETIDMGVSHVIQFQIIAGERRWRASRLAGLTKVPVVIKEVTPLQMLELALIENIQRADLNPIEEALAFQALIAEFGLTQEQVARQVGKDRSTITNAIRLLQLAPRVREALINSTENFSEGHARALIGIAREEDQIAALGKIITQKLNVRQTEELAARIKATERTDLSPQPSSIVQRTAELDELETNFRNSLMVKVDLKYNRKGKGTLVLHFNNQEELERLYSQLVKHKE